MNDGWDALAGFFAVIIAIYLIALTLIVLAIIWLAISLTVAYFRLRRYRQLAEQAYAEVEEEVGATIPVDEILHATWGAGVDLGPNGWGDEFDFVNETAFGIKYE